MRLLRLLGDWQTTLLLMLLAATIAAIYGLVFWWDSGRNDGEQTLIALDQPTEDRELTPTELAFFDRATDPGDASPGDVIDLLPLATGIDDVEGTVFRYWSSDLSGQLRPVSAVALWQRIPPPRPPTVVAFAHGTTGLADSCAPSRAFLSHGVEPGNVALEVVRAGSILIATDYQGLGIDGPHPYAVNQIAARNVLDSARAAEQVYEGTVGPVVLVGHSQGGGAVLLAAEIQPTYAPDVGMIGVAAGAPAAGFETLEAAYDGGPLFGFSIMAAAGYGAVYPDVAELAVPDRTRALLDAAENGCVGEVLSANEGLTESESGLDQILDAAAFEQRLDENEPGRQPPAAPVFLFHGSADETIPPSVSEDLTERYCELGADVTLGLYDGADHHGVFDDAVRDMQLFLFKLIDGEPTGSPACTGGQ